MFGKISKKANAYELKLRATLVKSPLIYGVLAAVSLVLFWRGVDQTAARYPVFTGPILILISVPILLVLGVFLPFFVNDRTLLTQLKNEEDSVLKKEQESKDTVRHVLEKMDEIDREVHDIEAKLHIRK